jgi:hypothetical protein
MAIRATFNLGMTVHGSRLRRRFLSDADPELGLSYGVRLVRMGTAAG